MAASNNKSPSDGKNLQGKPRNGGGANKKKNQEYNKKLVTAIVIVIVLIFIGLWLYDYFYGEKEGGIPPYAYGEGDLAVHFLDVGQGDCIIVQFPDGKNMIIDGGTTAQAGKVKGYIATYGITRFDYVMLTHTDSDHSGGLGGTLSGGKPNGVLATEGLSFGKIYMPKIMSKSEKDPLSQSNSITAANSNAVMTNAYREFVTAAADSGAEIIYTVAGIMADTTDEGGGYKVIIFAPLSLAKYSGVNENSSPALKNGVSPIVILEYNERRVAFTGDATGATEAEFLSYVQSMNAYDNVKVDVLKVAHHGADTEGSNSQEFLSTVLPSFAVISSNPSGNNYGHPHSGTLARLANIGATVFRTDTVGDIVCTLTEDSQILWYNSRDGQITVAVIKSGNFEALFVMFKEKPRWKISG